MNGRAFSLQGRDGSPSRSLALPGSEPCPAVGLRAPSRKLASTYAHAFTLIELLVTLAVIAVLTGIAFPAYQHMVQSSRAAACMSNLRQIGAALNLYLGEHNMVMPALKAGRASTADDVPVIDNTLNAYAPDPKVFACPGDTSGQATVTGTSYFWNVALSGQGMSTLNFFNHTGMAMIPVLSDKGAYHPYIPSRVNLLYADGHTDKEISFASPTP